jgi:hypothetical protein
VQVGREESNRLAPTHTAHSRAQTLVLAAPRTGNPREEVLRPHWTTARTGRLGAGVLDARREAGVAHKAGYEPCAHASIVYTISSTGWDGTCAV